MNKAILFGSRSPMAGRSPDPTTVTRLPATVRESPTSRPRFLRVADPRKTSSFLAGRRPSVTVTLGPPATPTTLPAATVRPDAVTVPSPTTVTEPTPGCSASAAARSRATSLGTASVVARSYGAP